MKKLLLLAAGFALAFPAFAQTAPSSSAGEVDAVTGYPRTTPPIKEWQPGKRVAVCFVLYVETWGFGHGPNLRPDLVSRKPDLVDEAFRNYAIHFGIERVGRIFQEENLSLSLALNAQFPVQYPDVWKRFRTLAPNAAIVAHGMNNSSELLPLGQGPGPQEAYIKKTLDLIEKETGIRAKGWSSPSVYNDADTFRASAHEGLVYSLDGMDSDDLTLLKTPEGPLQLIPYPSVTVDMGQFLVRNYKPADLAQLWIDYVSELAREAEKYPDRDATVVAIGIHPFVVGSPDGAVAMRQTLEALKKIPSVWITDTDAVSQLASKP